MFDTKIDNFIMNNCDQIQIEKLIDFFPNFIKNLVSYSNYLKMELFASIHSLCICIEVQPCTSPILEFHIIGTLLCL